MYIGIGIVQESVEGLAETLCAIQIRKHTQTCSPNTHAHEQHMRAHMNINELLLLRTAPNPETGRDDRLPRVTYCIIGPGL